MLYNVHITDFLPFSYPRATTTGATNISIMTTKISSKTCVKCKKSTNFKFWYRSDQNAPALRVTLLTIENAEYFLWVFLISL
jgi:hypothetical protein